MVMVQTSAEYINYPVDTSALSTMEEDAKRREWSKLGICFYRTTDTTWTSGKTQT